MFPMWAPRPPIQSCSDFEDLILYPTFFRASTLVRGMGGGSQRFAGCPCVHRCCLIMSVNRQRAPPRSVFCGGRHGCDGIKTHQSSHTVQRQGSAHMVQTKSQKEAQEVSKEYWTRSNSKKKPHQRVVEEDLDSKASNNTGSTTGAAPIRLRIRCGEHCPWAE